MQTVRQNLQIVPGDWMTCKHITISSSPEPVLLQAAVASTRIPHWQGRFWQGRF